MSHRIRELAGGGVCSPSGYKASGVCAGLKRSGAVDLALLCSGFPARAAGVFTSSMVKAAPVVLCAERLSRGGDFRAVVINSGVANACTGEQGLRNSRVMCDAVGKSLGVDPYEVLVCSTGRIGTQLPMEKIMVGVSDAAKVLDAGGGSAAAAAIMTTDTRPKECAVEFDIGGKVVRIGGMAKGAGMIAPRLKRLHATMICCVTTDAVIGRDVLQAELDVACEGSFNRISVDGDTSTNDTVLLFANGSAGNPEICPGSAGLEIFREALMTVLSKLARDIVLDGEGVTKFVAVRVFNAASDSDARLASRAICDSLLCKTAWFGCDPNWGRVLAAAGYSGAVFDPAKVNLHYDGIPVLLCGVDAGTPESELAEVMRRGEFEIELDLGCGGCSHVMWTNDLSYEYVKINADYHT